MMKMIKESTEQLSKQISSNINNFIAHHKTVSNISKKTGVLLLHRVNETNHQVQTFRGYSMSLSSVNPEQMHGFEWGYCGFTPVIEKRIWCQEFF